MLLCYFTVLFLLVFYYYLFVLSLFSFSFHLQVLTEGHVMCNVALKGT